MSQFPPPTDEVPAPQPQVPRPLGTKPYRVISFPGAGLDTVMQMGVIHAFLVTRRKAPEMVAGISVGAITATALGEVFQINAAPDATPREIEEIRVARFCELLEGFRNAPSTVLKGFFPDPLETNAAFALKPVELPRHFKEERDSREDAVASRTGLIRLLNTLIKLKVRVKVITQLVRVLLGWNAVEASHGLSRAFKRARLIARLWWIIARNIIALSMPAALVAKVELAEILGVNGKSRARGVEAGHIIFNRWGILRRVWDRSLRFLLGFLPLFLLLGVGPFILLWAISQILSMELPASWVIPTSTLLWITIPSAAALIGWAYLFSRKNIFSHLLKHYHIYSDLGDSHALKEVLVEHFDPAYYGEFRFDDSVRRALKQQRPATGGCSHKKTLGAYTRQTEQTPGIVVVPIAANLGTGKLESFCCNTPVVEALMCASAVVPFFRAQSINRGSTCATFIDGISVSNDPIMPVVEEASRLLSSQPGNTWDYLRITSVPLLPLKMERPQGPAEPYTGLVDVALRAHQLQRFQDMLLDKSLIDRVSRALGGKKAVVANGSSGPETFLPTKVRLVAPDRPPQINLRMMNAGSAAERRDLINTAVADGCRAMIERLVTDAMPDTRTPEERRLLLEPDEEPTDEWPHQDQANTASLRSAVESLRAARKTVTMKDGVEYVHCRKLMAAWGGLKSLPASDPIEAAGPGISEVCRCCIARHATTTAAGAKTEELRQHIRLPRVAVHSFSMAPEVSEELKGPAVVFLYSGGVFRGVFQVGFSNAASELGIQPDVVAGASVGTIIGSLTGRVFQKPAGQVLLERQRQTRRLAATFLTIDRFVLTDRFADFIRHFSIHAASADFSPHDLDLCFRRYEKDSALAFGRRTRRVFSGLERLFYLSPFEVMDLAKSLRAGDWQDAARQFKKLAQEMVDRYGVGLELLGSEPLQQLIDGFVFDGKAPPGTRLTHFGFPLMGTTTNLTTGKLDILRSTHSWDPRFTPALLAGSAFPTVFRPRWSWEVYRHPAQIAQYADGGIMDNLPLGAVVDYLWGKNSTHRYERRPVVPHLILTATLEPEKADWSHRTDLCSLSWTAIRARAAQLRYNGKIDRFQQGQRDIRRILKQRTLENDPDIHSPDLPLNLDVLAVKPQWLCGTFAFHPMLGFKRSKQTESIAHGCASTICAVADHFDPKNEAHAVDNDALRQWALSRGIALEQLPERISPEHNGALAYGPAKLTAEEQSQGACWFRHPDPKTGKRPICPFHAKSPAANEGEEVSPELHKIYQACGQRRTHQARNS